MLAAVRARDLAAAVHAHVPRLARVHHMVSAHLLLHAPSHCIAMRNDARHLYTHDIAYSWNPREIAKSFPALQLNDLLTNDLHVTQVAITHRPGAHRLNMRFADGVQRAGMCRQCDVFLAVVVACEILAERARTWPSIGQSSYPESFEGASSR